MNITLWIGIALVGVSGILAIREHLWLRNAEIASGTVVELIASRGSKDRTNYKPRVEFTANDGSKHEFVRNYSSNPAGYSVGDKVMVAYNASSYDGRILSFGQRFGIAAIMAAVGLGGIAMATMFIIGRHVVPKIYLQ